MRSERRRITLVFPILLATCLSVHPRPNGARFGVSCQEGPSTCSTNSTALAVLAQKTQPDDLIIVIARLGKRDTNQKFNHRRLHNVFVFLTEYTSVEGGRRDPTKVILAEGKRSTGLGLIEIYVKGKLTSTLAVKANGDLLVGNCYPDPLEADPCTMQSNKKFHPCIDRYKRRN